MVENIFNPIALLSKRGTLVVEYSSAPMTRKKTHIRCSYPPDGEYNHTLSKETVGISYVNMN